MPRFQAYLDLDGAPITWDGCTCDLDRPCNHPPCVMERDQDPWARTLRAHQRAC